MGAAYVASVCDRLNRGAFAMAGQHLLCALVFFTFVAAVALSDDAPVTADSMAKMSKEDLISALQKAQKQSTDLQTRLKRSQKRVTSLEFGSSIPSAAEEKKREHKEKANKAALKKKSLTRGRRKC